MMSRLLVSIGAILIHLISKGYHGRLGVKQPPERSHISGIGYRQSKASSKNYPASR
jgi:hypothetical protein